MSIRTRLEKLEAKMIPIELWYPESTVIQELLGDEGITQNITNPLELERAVLEGL